MIAANQYCFKVVVSKRLLFVYLNFLIDVLHLEA